MVKPIQLLILLCFTVLILAGVILFIFPRFASDSVSPTGSTFQQYTGIIWTSGLTSEEKVAFGINSDYQLVKSGDEGGWSGKITGLFLLPDHTHDLKSQLGKCVVAEGTTPTSWRNLPADNYLINGKWTYDRSALQVERLQEISLDSCLNPTDIDHLPELPTDQLQYKKISGTLTFSTRPAPDIGYDLKIFLDEPYLDEQNGSGQPVWTNTIVVTPASNAVYRQLLSLVGSRIEVGGYLNWGYAESQYLQVSTIYK